MSVCVCVLRLGDYGERSRGRGSVISAWIDFEAASIGYCLNGRNLGPGKAAYVPTVVVY